MKPIHIGYNKLWGVGMIGVAVLAVAAWLATRAFLYLGIAGMFQIAGVLWLIRPFLVVTDEEIQVKNMMGLTLRRFRHGGLARIDVVPGGLVIGAGERRQRLKLSALIASQRDLGRLAAAVEAARAAAADAPATAPSE
jgi:hypothetical protein